MNRRTVLSGVGAIGLTTLAGCLSTVGLDEHTAAPAGVSEETRDDTGYEQTGVEEIPIEERVGLTFLSEEVTARNYLTEHEKSVDIGPLGSQRAAVFMLLSTPQVNVLGQEFNPVAEMDTAELIDLVADNYNNISNVSHNADHEQTVLEQTTTRSEFTAEAQFDNTDVDVRLHVTTAIERGDDLLVAIGVYPDELHRQEEDNIVALVQSILADPIDPEAADTGEPDSDDEETDDEASGADDTSDDSDDGGSEGSDDDEDGIISDDEDEDEYEDDDGLGL
ncbi:DUF6517 family protein [Natronocalculus amylovorans]|uniref:DUF6517 family protein n=1 Tax=Natronocalculus amylovorans TaxID=2917812 RepID=A0AAE3K6S4_9EURY|nr:DUF6517 family protein [Natronocalculus amylovorans]MCL9815517.1 DUF6517 family protein [Natronocalculus amylovorans]